MRWRASTCTVTLLARIRTAMKPTATPTSASRCSHKVVVNNFCHSKASAATGGSLRPVPAGGARALGKGSESA